MYVFSSWCCVSSLAALCVYTTSVYPDSQKLLIFMSNSCSVGAGTVTGYGFDDRGFELESRRAQEFSLLHGIHTTSFPIGIGGSFPGVMWPGHELDHSLPASSEVRKMWIYTVTPPYTFMASCLIG
jgi:hypothetical protein